ncbi:GNAT family N-acetyltransferase [Actinosynnema pretiosum subsp. pretiosum]|uniref:GCN5-related N-acetyltransferase n=2 Tax=Actinosynnema TaxID=40566 RepID=C6WJE2_ACTMD|nr:GNAT family N-acetyltransferase [Actinosynnema mirum]ACU34574.1 GCN5-related N-acetyltransferase [Actinosynnema mirum DSM 43827]AXX27934.1 Enhanced intracellular survival protein [Actinosynnema pretiosum subsp. pretiosum]QUF07642.1 GNAT family N-acetyltransferase [Actinosynnema pretiosum subsp. pretiosum]
MLVRTTEQADVEAAAGLRSVAFGSARPVDPVLPPGQDALVAEADGRLVGTLGVWRHHQFWGGRTVPAGGIGGVAVDPHARGRGVATALLTRAVEDMRERGQALSLLYATVPALYRSCGWERAGVHEWISLTPGQLPTGGKPLSRAARPQDAPAVHACYTDLASTVDGMLDRSAPAFDPVEALDHNVASVVPGHDGEVRGYLLADRDGDGLRVLDLVARDLDTQLGLLGELASWGGVLPAFDLRVLDPATTGLLTDQAIKHTVTTRAWLMRVVDLTAAVAARGWPAATGLRSAAVDLDVTDPIAPWHAGRRRIVVEDGQVRVEPGGSGAVRVKARALGPWFSGFQNTHALRRAGLLDGDAALLDRLTASTGAPRLGDYF